MNPVGRPPNPLVAELLRVLQAKDYSDIMPAVQELQEQAAEGARLRAAVDGLLEKLVEEVEKEQGG